MGKGFMVMRFVASVMAFALVFSCGTQQASNASAGSESPAGFVSAAKSVPLPAASKGMKGMISSLDTAGNAILNIPVSDLLSGGFELGDGVAIDFSNGFKLKDVPYYNGYYGKNGDPLLRALPGHKFAAVCITNGSLSEAGGLKVGDTCVIRLSSKGKYHREQSINTLAYSDKRIDYESDAAFANFRNVKAGGIGKSRLYRSASPIDNSRSRAIYADQVMQGARVSFVLNLQDTRSEVNKYSESDDFRSSYYMRLFDTGRVILAPLPSDYASAEFKSKLAAGLRALADSNAKPPLLVHCIDGRDRTGFVIALFAALMGASYDEIADDYMVSYANYHGITKEKDAQRYSTIVANNIDVMLKLIAGVSDVRMISGDDMRNGAMRYLKGLGLNDDQIRKLVALLG